MHVQTAYIIATFLRLTHRFLKDMNRNLHFVHSNNDNENLLCASIHQKDTHGAATQQCKTMHVIEK